MLNSAIIEVIIGLIFVYSLLSILVTQVNTIVANVFQLRSQHLKKGLVELVSDPTTQARLLTHPLICLVKREFNANAKASAQTAQAVANSGTNDVLWIEPRLFADVITELITQQSNAEPALYSPLVRIASTILDTEDQSRFLPMISGLNSAGLGFQELRSAISALPDPAAREALLVAFNEAQAASQEFRTDSGELIALLKGVRNIQQPDFRQAMDTLIGAVKSVEEAKKRLEKWFDNSMDQVSDKYRRTMQYISLFVGLMLVLILNVDTLHMARTLWDDPAVRVSVADAARTSLETGNLEARMTLTAPTPVAPTPDPSALGAVTAQSAEATPDPLDVDPPVAEAVTSAQTTLNDLLSLRVPIGWTFSPVNVVAERNPLDIDPLQDGRNLWNYWPGNNPNHWLGLVLQKIAGIVLSIIAVSQGAPFWFDLLNRIARGKTS